MAIIKKIVEKNQRHYRISGNGFSLIVAKSQYASGYSAVYSSTSVGADDLPLNVALNIAKIIVDHGDVDIDVMREIVHKKLNN